ncbi:MAG: hypothetical protein LUG13_05180 [Oscillospiraceae bacterium]|nr:hypothetical protein [Oscillospiraceae bacterium]
MKQKKTKKALSTLVATVMALSCLPAAAFAAEDAAQVTFEADFASVQVDGKTVDAAAGQNVAFTVTPDAGRTLGNAYSTFEVAGVYANGSEIAAQNGVYTITDVTAPVGVRVAVNEVWSSKGSIYTIATAEELRAFSQEVSSGNDFSGELVRLTADIDLEGVDFYPIGDSTRDENTYFSGVFDGAGYSIYNLNVNRNVTASTFPYYLGEKYVQGGLFGSVSDAVITNVTVASGTVRCNQGNGVGGIVGFATNTDIINCVNYADIVAGGTTAYMGGIVGAASARDYGVYGCVNYGTIYSEPGYSGGYTEGHYGGITGFANQIACCANYGDITMNYGGAFEESATLSGYVGGIAGGTLSDLDRCYNAGDISAYAKSIGGIVGNTGWNTGSTNEFTISNCYNTGNLTYNGDGKLGSGHNYRMVGGIVAYSYTHFGNRYVENCYSTGALTLYDAKFKTIMHNAQTGEDKEPEFIDCVGNIVGYAYTPMDWVSMQPMPSDYDTTVTNCPEEMDGVTAADLGSAFVDRDSATPGLLWMTAGAQAAPETKRDAAVWGGVKGACEALETADDSVSASVYINEPLVLEAYTENLLHPDYRWYDANGEAITGENSASFFLKSADTPGTTTYSCRVNDSYEITYTVTTLTLTATVSASQTGTLSIADALDLTYSVATSDCVGGHTHALTSWYYSKDGVDYKNVSTDIGSSADFKVFGNLGEKVYFRCTASYYGSGKIKEGETYYCYCAVNGVESAECIKATVGADTITVEVLPRT